MWSTVVAVAASGCDSGPEASDRADATATIDSAATDAVATDAIATDAVATDAIATDAIATDTTAETTTSDTSPPDTAVAAPCPAAGPFGTTVGATLADFTMLDADGQPFALSSTCARAVTYINAFAGWCPPCQADAEDAPSDFAALEHRGGDIAWYFIVTETAGGVAPSLAYCQQIREDYALPMRVLCDVDGAFESVFGTTSSNSWHVVLSPGQVIAYKAKYGHDGAFQAIDQLTPTP